MIDLSDNSLDISYFADDIQNVVNSDKSVTPNFQEDIFNSSLGNSPNSKCYSEPCTPSSDQEWRGDIFKNYMDEIELKSASNNVVKRLKKPLKKPKKKPENSNFN